MGVSPEKAPDKATYVTIHFEKGIPTAIDGVEMDGPTLVKKLNKLGGENGIGLADIVKNRLVGMKSRAFMRPPAAPSSTTPTRCWRPSAWIKKPSTTNSR